MDDAFHFVVVIATKASSRGQALGFGKGPREEAHSNTDRGHHDSHNEVGHVHVDHMVATSRSSKTGKGMCCQVKRTANLFGKDFNRMDPAL